MNVRDVRLSKLVRRGEAPMAGKINRDLTSTSSPLDSEGSAHRRDWSGAGPAGRELSP